MLSKIFTGIKNKLRIVRKPTRSDRVWHVIDLIPVILPASLAGFGVVAMILLVTNNFETALIWPAGLLAAVAIAYLIIKISPARVMDKEAKAVLLIVLLGVVAWTGFNVLLSSQHVHTNRDPAIYGTSSLRLADEKSLQTPSGQTLNGVQGITETSGGYGKSKIDPDYIHAQGAHMLPALLGSVGKFVDDSIMLRLNPILGGIALLAVFGFARMIMRDRWALVATLALSVSMPMLYFSRDTYTEPLMAALVFGALSLVALADRTNKAGFWLLAGLVAGAIGLVRIDAPMTIAGVLAGATIYLMVANKGLRMIALRNALLLMVPLALVCLLAWYDVSQLSSVYYNSQKSKIIGQYLAIGGLLAVAIIAVALAWRTRILEALDKVTGRWRGIFAVSIVVGGAALLASRPVWLISHRHNEIPTTGALQRATGLPVDAMRDYGEQTLNWMIWYIGPVLVAASIIGFSLAIYKAMKTRSIVWITSLAVILAVAVFYFIKPSITPDHVWAARRFLPVVIPGIAIFGALGLQWLYERQKKVWGISTQSITLVLAALAVTFPLMVSYPLMFVKTFGTQLAQTKEICTAVSDNEKSIILWIGIAGYNLIEPTRETCDVNSYRVLNRVKTIDADFLSNIAHSAQERGGYQLFVGAYSADAARLGSQATRLSLISGQIFYDYEHTLVRPPVDVEKNIRQIMMGKVELDGTISKIH